MRIAGVPSLGPSIIFEDIHDYPDFTVESLMIRISLIRDVHPDPVTLLEPSHFRTVIRNPSAV
jgi:hypothetical protein